MRDAVRRKYAAAATTVLQPSGGGCCSSGGGDSCCSDAITGGLYDDQQAASVPGAALRASLGCGNPTALAALRPGEVLLDLGSGGGIDVLLSARRVGPTGFAYGLDMTDEMLALAERNRIDSGVSNAAFLRGEIESIPLPDSSVDVVISNCVINLSADKDAVLREALRVLRPGGRFAVSDVVVDGEMPAAVRADMEAYVGCVAGALDRADYLARLERAGFVDASIEPTRRYTFDGLASSGCCAPSVAALSSADRSTLDGRVMGAFIRASKPPAALSSSSAKQTTVLFVCVHNAGRSQMAEAFVNALAKQRGLPVRAVSAGTLGSDEINPVALQSMWEAGIPMDGQRPKLLTQPMADSADRAITMGCGVDAEACPSRLGAAEDWGLDDPNGQPVETVRAIRDQIRLRVESLLAELGR